MQKNGVFLGFDFGMKRIGSAVGQSITKQSKALKTISAKNGEPDWDTLEDLIDTWSPEALIVGIPLNMDGTEQEITQHAKTFAHKLKHRFNLPIFEEDERLSTIEAKQNLYDIGGYKALKKKEIDCFAAKIILDSWLINQT